MNGATVTADPQIGIAPAGSHFVGLGDYNADGKTDLLFENDTTHALTNWQMDGVQIAQVNQLGSVNAPADWHLIGRAESRRRQRCLATIGLKRGRGIGSPKRIDRRCEAHCR